MELQMRNIDGLIVCSSEFMTTRSIVNRIDIDFNTGLNIIIGDPDSVGWSLSSFISKEYDFKKSFIEKSYEIVLDNKELSHNELAERACYLGDRYKYKKKVPDVIGKNIKKHNIEYTVKDIQTMFNIDERFDRKLRNTGNFIWECTAAIGVSQNKSIYCFPWLSKTDFKHFIEHIKSTVNTLVDLNYIVIMPISYAAEIYEFKHKPKIFCLECTDKGQYFLQERI